MFLVNDMYMVIIIIAIMIIVAIGSYFYKKYVVIPYKNNVIKKNLKEINPNIEYYFENSSFDFKPINKQYSLINNAQSFNITDIIVDDNITSYDLHATHTQSSGKTSTTVTDFKGRFYEVKIDKKYLCDFILKEEKWDRHPEGFTLLDLELTEFNDKFNLYVTDKLESHHYFTPFAIKRLVDLERSLDDRLVFAYINGILYFGVNDNANFFEHLKTKEEVKKEYLAQRAGVLKFKEIIERDE